MKRITQQQPKQHNRDEEMAYPMFSLTQKCLPSFGDSLLLLITCSLLQHSCCVSTSELHESDEHHDLLAKGILFHEETKSLLAEKFINVEFLVPYPRYRFSVREELSPLHSNLSKMWEMPSLFCPLDFRHTAKQILQNSTWFFTRIEKETTDVEEVLHLRNETSHFLSSKKM